MSAPVMAAVAASSLILALPVLAAAEFAVAANIAARAADASALAAADGALGFIDTGGASPCELAAEVSALNGAELSRCEVEESSGEAEVTATVRVGAIPVARSARAGPPTALHG